ncbi:hypothetical protein EIP91_001095 [Steccherinum ochraceum]|uniref:Glucose-methanol-choline oxidoreductase N-terminal domain-containing protein n=1 Tax=Steccherinum ochraceum TaxID=92696 RepID=A0A4R0RS73_9APHY|nr:hypothetical protein EIP91_001095 [Steccherinum ochraceum]
MSYDNAEFDIIFAGGGTAACYIAGRLAAAEPSLKILVIEAGPHTENGLAHIQPAQFPSHMVPGSKTIKFVVSQPSEHLGGRPLVVPSGQCVGGGSSVNFAVFNRASASEYDDWENKFNNPGWGSKDLIPLLMKARRMLGFQIEHDQDRYGSSGPIKVSYGGYFGRVSQDFLDTAAEYDKDRRVTSSGSDVSTANTYGRWPKWVSTAGRRSDVPHQLIYPTEMHPNLRFLTEHLVKRVIIQNGRAVGVECFLNPQYHPQEPLEVLKVYAKRQVVVSAGSLGSPLILERSGIGAAAVLEQNGVQQFVDLPAVGERYHDHQLVLGVYRTGDEYDTMDSLVRGEPEAQAKWHAQWLEDGTGMMASNGIDAAVKMRPVSVDEVRSIGPEFEKKWESFYADHPDRSVLWIGCCNFCLGQSHIAPKGNYYVIGWFLHHPSSIGRIHITSGEDALAPPDFSSGFCENEDDMELHVWGYKKTRELARRMTCYRGELTSGHPAFEPSSAAVLKEDSSPVSVDAPNIQYTEADEEAIRIFVRKIVSSGWHSLGTCAMMPREQGGVVDSRLNVYGVEGLKVADLSIAPSNVGANTYSTVCAIAEKATLILAEDLGIQYE